MVTTVHHAALALLLTACVLSPTAARAASNNSWAVTPGTEDGSPSPREFYDYTLASGEAVQDYLTISNLTDAPLRFRLYAADAYMTETGDFALRLEDQERTGVGAWVALPMRTVSVGAQMAATLPFQLGIPRGIAPGDYAGGIVAVAVPDEIADDNSQLVVEHGVGARLFVRVDGALNPSLDVDTFDMHIDGSSFAASADAEIEYEVVNTGNARLTPVARLEVRDLVGRTVKRFPERQLAQLFPGDSVTITERWEEMPMLGARYVPRLVVTDGDVRLDRSGASAWRIPWPVLALIATALILALLAAALLRARRARHAAPVGGEAGG